MPLQVSDCNIVDMVNRWLVHPYIVQQNVYMLNLIRELMPHYKYEGTMYRGVYKNAPYAQSGECIQSWSKSLKGIKKMERYALYTFGFVSKKDKAVEMFNSEKFITVNEEYPKEEFDNIIQDDIYGIDLYHLAKDAGYREDFLSLLKEMEIILVIK